MIVIKQIIILVFWILIFKTSYSQCNNSGSVDWNNLQQKTGNSDWDTQISYATYNLKAFFGTDADVFYSDSEELNAFALKKKDNFSRHKVCITKGMLKFLSVDQSKYWPINLSIILSHEWGHLLQYDFEIYFSIPKHYELLSDCMSSFMFSIEMSA